MVAVLGHYSLWVANAGDSRAVLCRGGNAIALSQDHKANRDDEVARVQAAGGHVWWNRWGLGQAGGAGAVLLTGSWSCGVLLAHPLSRSCGRATSAAGSLPSPSQPQPARADQLSTLPPLPPPPPPPPPQGDGRARHLPRHRRPQAAALRHPRPRVSRPPWLPCWPPAWPPAWPASRPPSAPACASWRRRCRACPTSATCQQTATRRRCPWRGRRARLRACLLSAQPAWFRSTTRT